MLLPSKSFLRPMIADRMRAILPMIKALNEMRAKNPMANGNKAAAFNFINNKRGNNIFLVFFPLPRAVNERKGNSFSILHKFPTTNYSPSSKDLWMSVIESCGTFNCNVCDPKKRAMRSINRALTSVSLCSGSSDKLMSLIERPCEASSVWTSLIPSVISTSPAVSSTNLSARSWFEKLKN